MESPPLAGEREHPLARLARKQDYAALLRGRLRRALTRQPLPRDSAPTRKSGREERPLLPEPKGRHIPMEPDHRPSDPWSLATKDR